VTYKLDLKALTALNYYKLNSLDNLYSHIDSYIHFLKNNHLVPARLEAWHLNFLKFLSKLLKARESNNKKEIEELKFELNKSQYFTFKDWFVKELA
jgi:hypothetical protein